MKHKRLLIVIFTTVSIAFLISIGFSKIYWGYYFTPPELNEEKLAIQTVNNQISLAEVLRYSQNQKNYDPLGSRILILLKKTGTLLSDDKYLDKHNLEAIHGSLMKDVYRLDNYRNVDFDKYGGHHWGYIVEYLGNNNREYFFVTIYGFQLYNDHYPFYEFLYVENSANQLFLAEEINHYYYEVAGIEAFTWVYVFISLCIIGFIVDLAVFLLMRLIRKKKQNNRTHYSNRVIKM